MFNEALKNEKNHIISNKTLENTRWIALFGQLAAVTLIYFGFGFELPLLSCLLVIGLAAMVGVAEFIYTRFHVQLSRFMVLSLLSFDIIQLGVLLYLTGGLTNPFAIMLIAPVAISATVLPKKDIILLVIVVVVIATILVWQYQPLPWYDSGFAIPTLYVLGLWTALVLTMGFIASYAALISYQSRNLARGLAEARLTIAREQQKTALGSLATAVAHKLGSPLNTITLIAHDLEQVKTKKDLKDDIKTLIEETDRCRHILGELNEDAFTLGHEAQDPMPLTLMVQGLISEQFEDSAEMIEIKTQVKESEAEPIITRRPELFHPFEILIDNAVQFAKSHVTIALDWDKNAITITIDDDGEGFPPAILSRLGTPYVSSRGGKDGHMGLGIFIAKTMIEQMEGKLVLANHQDGGGRAKIIYPRQNIDVTGS